MGSSLWVLGCHIKTQSSTDPESGKYCERMVTLKPQVHSPEKMEICVHGWLKFQKKTDKEMGNFWAQFWFVICGGAREVPGVMGGRGSGQECF